VSDPSPPPAHRGCGSNSTASQGVPPSRRRKLLRFHSVFKKGRKSGLPTRLKGYYIWAAEHEEGKGAEREGSEPEATDAVAVDEVYAEHLDLLAHHPGFQMELARLRAARPTRRRMGRVAGNWGLATPDLHALVEASTDDDVKFAVSGDKVFVEIHPAEYVLRIPRPITPARRDAVTEWLRWERRIPRPVKPGPHDPELRTVWARQRHGHRAPKAQQHLDWYVRWHGGASAMTIYNDAVEDGEVDPEHVRNTLRTIHRRMWEISPEGLRDDAP